MLGLDDRRCFDDSARITATRFLASLHYAAALDWLVRFGTRIVARRLDVPEIVVHAICLYVAAYVSEVERNAALVCPIRVFKELRRHHVGQTLRNPPSPLHLTKTSPR